MEKAEKLVGKAENEVPEGVNRILALMWMDSSLELLTVLAGYRWMGYSISIVPGGLLVTSNFVRYKFLVFEGKAHYRRKLC